ncbi:MAG: hypothetical protein ABSA97_05525 [Verrucomicrobiia bacterium]|jgi:predicted outer membrane lipoprotein
MNPKQSPTDLIDQRLLGTLKTKINKALENHSDKDRNHSRIPLRIRFLHTIEGPYALWLELVPTNAKQRQNDLTVFTDAIAWDERHSNELGILETISLRENRALLEASTDDSWDFRRPTIRLVSKEVLAQQGIPSAIWYEVHEASDEEFDNR